METISIHNLFYQLIRVAIGTQEGLSRLPSEHEWGKLYIMAEKQSLIGVCFAALRLLGADADGGFSRIGMSKMLYLTWMGMSVQIQKRNEIVDQQCADLQEKIFADGFKSCLLKGQSVAQLYNDHLCQLRQSGDIDLWVDAPRDKTVEYVMGIAPTRDVNFQHIHFNVLEDTAVELHMMPVSRYNPRRNRLLKKYFDSEVDRQCANRKMIGCHEMSVPTVDFQLVHQLLHVYSHYVYEGVGMRQVMDLFFAQKACDEGIDKVLTLFKKLGLMRFVAGTQWVLREVFQMPNEQLLCDPDDKEGRQILSNVMEGGNFGHYSTKNRVKGESTMKRMWRHFRQSVRMIRFDLLGTVCAPWYRIRIELWRRRIGKRYGV